MVGKHILEIIPTFFLDFQQIPTPLSNPHKVQTADTPPLVLV
jgi:hypothetical protein